MPISNPSSVNPFAANPESNPFFNLVNWLAALELNGLFDGSAGYVAYAERAWQTGEGDSLTSLFDGTGGYVSGAVGSDRTLGLWNGSDFTPSEYLFDGTEGYSNKARFLFESDEIGNFYWDNTENAWFTTANLKSASSITASDFYGNGASLTEVNAQYFGNYAAADVFMEGESRVQYANEANYCYILQFSNETVQWDTGNSEWSFYDGGGYNAIHVSRITAEAGFTWQGLSYGDINNDGGFFAAYFTSGGGIAAAENLTFQGGGWGDINNNGSWEIDQLFVYGQAICYDSLRLATVSVSALPPAASGGEMMTIDDALTPTAGGIAVGGGAQIRPVFFDGTNWRTLY